MYEWRDFPTVFHNKPDFTPDQKHAEAAIKHRRELGGALFFDRLWTVLRLDKGEPERNHIALQMLMYTASKSYPPKSNADLRAIWNRIVKAPVGDESKAALLYYLILDTRKQNLQQTFAQRSFLPQKYQLLINGLWHLDQCHFAQALEYLTDPSLTPVEFGDEILSALIQHPKCDNALAMAFYLAVRPPLTHDAALGAYMQLLAATNITEAYNFAKQHPQHKSLFEQLVLSVFSMKPSEDRASAAVQLIGLPFDEDEEKWFENILLHGEASKLPGAKDSVLARRLAYGRPVHGNDAVARYKGTKIDGVNWEDIRGIAAG